MDIINCEYQVNHDTTANIIESIAMLCKNFSNVMRRLDKRSGNNVSTNVKYNQHQNLKGGKFQRREKYCER